MHFRHNIWHGVMLGECLAAVIVRVGSAKRNSSPCSGGAPQSSPLQNFSNFNVHTYHLGQSCWSADSDSGCWEGAWESALLTSSPIILMPQTKLCIARPHKRKGWGKKVLVNAFSWSLIASDFHRKGSLKLLHHSPEELHCSQPLSPLVPPNLIPAAPTGSLSYQSCSDISCKDTRPLQGVSLRTEKEEKERVASF